MFRYLKLNQIVESDSRYDVSNEDGCESDVGVRKDKTIRHRLIVHIEVSSDTKIGRPLVICLDGIYFRRITNFCKNKTGFFPKPDDFILMNSGTTHSKKMDFVGRSLSSDHLIKLWHELINDLKVDKDVDFSKN